MVIANGSLSGLAKNAAKNVINCCLGSFSQVCTSSWWKTLTSEVKQNWFSPNWTSLKDYSNLTSPTNWKRVDAFRLHFCLKWFVIILWICFSVEVVLMKQTQEHHWSSVVRGDERGTYELVGEDAERVKEIHNRLEHLTSDKPVSLLLPLIVWRRQFAALLQSLAVWVIQFHAALTMADTIILRINSVVYQNNLPHIHISSWWIY